MTNDKKRRDNLIAWANNALHEQAKDDNLPQGTGKMLNGTNINESYNGAVAALGVSVAMGGLRPTLVIYYQDKQEKDTRPKANRRTVLDVIARMIIKDVQSGQQIPNWNCEIDNYGYAHKLFNHVLQYNDEILKQEIIDCSIALKHIVRTYNLVK